MDARSSLKPAEADLAVDRAARPAAIRSTRVQEADHTAADFETIPRFLENRLSRLSAPAPKAAI